jgi:hypothetical protein
MDFSDDILKKIVGMGSRGFSPSRIANELNMHYDQLLDECKVNEKFKDAFDRAVLNYERYLIDEIMDASIDIRAKVQTEVFKKLIEKHGGNSDNSIQIEIV